MMREREEADSCCSWRMDSAARGEGGKRRFSEEQIKSLESMFQTQSKLEARQKLALAGELGLQPRQVSIWFQNKRARWKSKQLEREYGALRADYDALLASFEALKEEKQMLAKQLEKLAEAKQSPQGREVESEKRVAMYPEEEEKKKIACLSEEGAELYAAVGRGSSTLTSLDEQQQQQQQLCFNTTWVSSDQMCTSTLWWLIHE